MANKKQKIIFDLPEDALPVKTILDILKKFGVEDDTSSEKTPKFILVLDIVRDFFDKKISEAEMTKLLQEKIGISKDVSLGIISELKEKIIPFAKKVDVPPDEPEINEKQIINTEQVENNQPPIGVVKALQRKSETKIEMTPPQPTIKKNVPDTKQKLTAPLTPVKKSLNQKDTYREPIE